MRAGIHYAHYLAHILFILMHFNGKPDLLQLVLCSVFGYCLRTLSSCGLEVPDNAIPLIFVTETSIMGHD